MSGAAIRPPLLLGGTLADATPWQALLNEAEPKVVLASTPGDFAIGLINARGRTVLAVDRFATQTLCYRLDAGQLHFAERADQLGATELDAQALFDYLYFHCIPSPRTVFAGVQRLPPGHVAVFEGGHLQVEPFWTPSFTEPAQPSFDALRDEFM